MKLSKENLQFIDNYLKFNEVVYFDIRLEMLDHVATAVEQKMNEEQLEFYDAFKEYMVQNKKEVMKFNKGAGFYFQPIKNFGSFLFKPQGLVLLPIVYLFNYFISQQHDFQAISLYIYPAICLFCVLFSIIVYYFSNRRRYFYLEQNSVILFVIVQLLQMFLKFDIQNIQRSLCVNSILLFLLLSFVLFYFNELRTFKAKNKYLFL
jgi:hypothetical protein